MYNSYAIINKNILGVSFQKCWENICTHLYFYKDQSNIANILSA